MTMAEEFAKNGEVAEKKVSFVALKPRLSVEAPKAAEAVDFYKAAFGAVETERILHPKRKADQELPHILAAHLDLAGVTFIVSDSADSLSAEKTGSNSMLLCLVTEDVEAAVAKAVAAGAVKDDVGVTEGEGVCGVQVKVKDPYGFTWLISSAGPEKAADVEA